MSISKKSSVSSGGKFDPLLRDLDEKKESFRRNVVLLAAELQEVRNRLASQEQSLPDKTSRDRHVEVERKMRNMEEEICALQKRIEEKNRELLASASAAEKYLAQVDALRLQLSTTQATADASAASAQSVQLQCLTLMQELDKKNCSLKEYEDRVNHLGDQLENLQKGLLARETSQKQLKDEILRMENDIMEALSRAGESKNCELRKILDEVSPRNIENLNKLLMTKDAALATLRDDIRTMSVQWKLKTEELESQLEKQLRVDQELKKRVLKLEFCLQEVRSQTRKLQRSGDRRDRAIKELRDTAKRRSSDHEGNKENFWDIPAFKIVVTMSMLALVVFSKR